MASTDPKTATQGQWEDLATRVKAKSDVVISMTATDPGEGSALAADHYIGVYGGDPIIMDYSTSEVNTGTKWINGAVVYKKTINLGSLPNNTVKAVAHSISNLDFVIDVQATASDGVNRIVIPATATTGTASQVSIYIDGTNVNITSGNDRSGYSGYATLYYTKSSS